jgi:hypothetical protein
MRKWGDTCGGDREFNDRAFKFSVRRPSQGSPPKLGTSETLVMLFDCELFGTFWRTIIYFTPKKIGLIKLSLYKDLKKKPRKNLKKFTGEENYKRVSSSNFEWATSIGWGALQNIQQLPP